MDVGHLKGVGPAMKDKLTRLGIFRVMDLLLHLPLRYQDRSTIVPLGALRPDMEALVSGEVIDSSVAFGRRRSWRVTISDTSGYLTLRFFHFSANQQKGLRAGMSVQCFGTVRYGPKGLEMVHPEYRVFDQTPPPPSNSLLPVYPTTRGLGQARLRSLIDQVTDLHLPDDDEVPYSALLTLHRPPAGATAEELAQLQQKVAFDELTAYYLIMKHRQLDRVRKRALALPPERQLGRALLDQLGFQLTHAQRRVLKEVFDDLSQATPMLRLLQGDVGSGKTVIAAFAAIRAAEHGVQTALMAPTEILAEQHYVNFSSWLDPLGVGVALITGSQSARERAAQTERLKTGDALVAVGTHALFQKSVAFKRLGLAIIDEQHRFGVHQRMALRDKSTEACHQLVMTATPIPRTLTMALYADMAVSVIDELPPGREPIETRLIANSRRDEVIERMHAALQRGNQAYWVCTLIDTSETLDAASTEDTYTALSQAMPDIPIGQVHGRMTGEEKAKVMGAFKSGAIRLLVATTVIEVGVDVPNASLMVIENPERLGLAQLHQLRGRIGRGSRASACILLYGDGVSEVSQTRLGVIRDSQDGFQIAEADLKARGPGELLGARQTGEQQFRIADLNEHAHLIPKVIERGDAMLSDHPEAVARLLRAWAPADIGHLSA
jgi:ATP-dependent DNA helicase RecG